METETVAFLFCKRNNEKIKLIKIVGGRTLDGIIRMEARLLDHP